MSKSLLYSFLFSILSLSGYSQEEKFNGVNLNLGNIFRVSDAETRSISPENFTGEPGKAAMAKEGTGSHAARELGQGWKVSPSVKIQPGETYTMAEVSDQGVIQHMWMTPTGNWRHTILRIYWDGEEEPSVEVPVGDFFGMGWGEYAPLNSQPITVNPGSAFNSFWPMPFRKKFKITMENISAREMTLYYQIDYALTEVPSDAAYFHAQFRRSNPTEGAIHTLVDGIKGKGHYVGTYMAWQVNNRGWWGEGEIKFYMDGDDQFPTIAGTGTEDYFLGSYNFENKKKREYERYSTPFAGLHQIIKPDGLYNSQQRFGLYRWHIQDPIRFEEDLKVTIQDLGWRSGHRYLQQKSDISSVVYWYQLEPHAPFPALPSKNDLEVN
ncbi:glycoside hydrolase family 172 protein [Salegentibacter sp. F14]